MKPYDLAIIGTGVKGGPISGRRVEWAPDGGHDQAAVLTVCRACCFSNCTGLR